MIIQPKDIVNELENRKVKLVIIKNWWDYISFKTNGTNDSNTLYYGYTEFGSTSTCFPLEVINLIIKHFVNQDVLNCSVWGEEPGFVQISLINNKIYLKHYTDESWSENYENKNYCDIKFVKENSEEALIEFIDFINIIYEDIVSQYENYKEKVDMPEELEMIDKSLKVYKLIIKSIKEKLTYEEEKEINEYSKSLNLNII